MTEEDLLEVLTAFMPETLEGWLALAVILCAFLAIILPAPKEGSHPAWKTCHRAICILGMGAGKLRAAGKIGKIAGLFRSKK